MVARTDANALTLDTHSRPRASFLMHRKRLMLQAGRDLTCQRGQA